MTTTLPPLSPRFPNLWKEHPDAVAAIACAVLVSIGWQAIALGWISIALGILAIAYIVGGFDSAREGLTTLIEEKELDVDLLMIVAALGAAALGLWRREYYLIVDGAVLILIFAISGALEGYATKRTERSIRGLMSLTSDTARVVENGREAIVPISEVRIGARVLVKPGELVPTDGRVIEGFSSVNQASLTGESIPVEKTIGDEVFAGTINGSGALKIEIHKQPESSLIQRIIDLVRRAQQEAPPSQEFIERFERVYAKGIVIAGILLGTLPPFVLGWSWEQTIYRALIFLVVASPCALMASIMPTLLSGIANGARKGILFKNGARLETLGRVRAIAFDKTGTLTTGELRVVDLVTDGKTPNELLRVAAALESLSEHPIGEAIVREARQLNLTWPEAIDGRAIAGRGIIGRVDGEEAIAGRESFIREGIDRVSVVLSERASHWESEGKTVVWVARAGEILGIIAVADTIRPAAARAIERLKKLGIERIVMLTGDNASVARNIAERIGVDEVHAELLPEGKVDAIRSLQTRFGTVAMVGDGINDAPALAMASVGIAMGTAGSDVALETADIVLMADRLERLEEAISIGRRASGIVKQNIVFALGFIVLLLVLNFVAGITLPIGVLGHEGSTLAVTLNGLRLLRQ